MENKIIHLQQRLDQQVPFSFLALCKSAISFNGENCTQSKVSERKNLGVICNPSVIEKKVWLMSGVNFRHSEHKAKSYFGVYQEVPHFVSYFEAAEFS